MPPKTRKASKAASAASSQHLHPSSAAAAAAEVKAAKPSTASSSSSAASTVNGGTHIPLKTSSHTRNKAYDHDGWTWNPIKIIERKLFRAYWNVEATFVLSMLEAWEVFLVIVVFVVLTLLLWYSLIHYFPRHAQQVATRALYYVYGNSPPPQLAAAVTTSASNATTAASTAAEGVLEKLIASSNQLWDSLNAQKAAQGANPELVDLLISNLNKVKQMMASTAKSEL